MEDVVTAGRLLDQTGSSKLFSVITRVAGWTRTKTKKSYGLAPVNLFVYVVNDT